MSNQVGDSNIEAYEIMAEILVTVRKIVHRGLEKAAGKTWYLDGCPPGVYERLVARKENEVAIDRFDREYQELISFASLDDLAEIIEQLSEYERLLWRNVNAKVIWDNAVITCATAAPLRL